MNAQNSEDEILSNNKYEVRFYKKMEKIVLFSINHVIFKNHMIDGKCEIKKKVLKTT
jgi:hypothetical protein